MKCALLRLSDCDNHVLLTSIHYTLEQNQRVSKFNPPFEMVQFLGTLSRDN